jgi:MarR family transcriptional regulator, lower aerobic nicotinate degradation pathway regulator
VTAEIRTRSEPDVRNFEEEQSKRLNYLIRRMHQTADALYLEEAGRYEVTSVQMACLRAIEARPGVDQLRLARALKLDRTTIAGVVLRLQRKKLISRERDETDRRSILLYATAAGEELLTSLIPAVDRAQRRMLAPLRPAERRALLDLMARIVEEAPGEGRRSVSTLSARSSRRDTKARAAKASSAAPEQQLKTL